MSEVIPVAKYFGPRDAQGVLLATSRFLYDMQPHLGPRADAYLLRYSDITPNRRRQPIRWLMFKCGKLGFSVDNIKGPYGYSPLSGSVLPDVQESADIIRISLGVMNMLAAVANNIRKDTRVDDRHNEIAIAQKRSQAVTGMLPSQKLWTRDNTIYPGAIWVKKHYSWNGHDPLTVSGIGESLPGIARYWDAIRNNRGQILQAQSRGVSLYPQLVSESDLLSSRDVMKFYDYYSEVNSAQQN